MTMTSNTGRPESRRISKRHRSEQQVALRACIWLAAAQGYADARIARDLAIDVYIARL